MEVIYEGVAEGIEYKVVRFKRNGHIALYIKCPRCGEFGKLSKYRNGFIIRHRVNSTKILVKVCQFGWTSDEHEILRKIYEIKDELVAKVIRK